MSRTQEREMLSVESVWLIGGAIVVQALLFWSVLLVERSEASKVWSVLWSTVALLVLFPATWMVLFALLTFYADPSGGD
jgi:hypothetical protein